MATAVALTCVGSAVAELLAEVAPTKIRQVGVADVFGQSGKPDELLSYYKLDTAGIVQAVLAVLGRVPVEANT